ncbi:hypothetical protein AWM68_19730 [Fictibacillus phosphorivorans]|uniref:Uncharacterized protein n=2 Tax=Fictibacillus phosphorivorans TaxID=1221500 RepID=A0A163RKV2_9BACL|nr:hypothetical protein AWM68_19730 [Fictibacillus phosphorivorans]
MIDKGYHAKQALEVERQKLLERAKDFKYVPGHGPNLENMTNEQLKKYNNVMESVFKDAFETEGKE